MKISIIIPFYNAEKYLSLCLDSIVSQDLTNYEIILVNDGSTDSSLAIAKNYVTRFNFIKLIDQKNCGVFLARNKGLIEARGEYVTFLDSDDYLKENSLSIFKTMVDKDCYDIIFFDLELKSENILFKSRPYLPIIHKDTTPLKAMFLDSNALSGYIGGKIFRRKTAYKALPLLEMVDKRLELYEDCYFLFCISLYCSTAYTSPKKLYVYRIHDESVTQKTISIDKKIDKLGVARSCFYELGECPVVKDNTDATKTVDKIMRVISSAEFIEKAKKEYYVSNIYKALKLDPRLTNHLRLAMYFLSLGKIKK